MRSWVRLPQIGKGRAPEMQRASAGFRDQHGLIRRQGGELTRGALERERAGLAIAQKIPKSNLALVAVDRDQRLAGSRKHREAAVAGLERCAYLPGLAIEHPTGPVHPHYRYEFAVG